MTLLIAIVLINACHLPRWWYVLAIMVWIVHVVWNSRSDSRIRSIETLARAASRMKCGAQPCRATSCRAPK